VPELGPETAFVGASRAGLDFGEEIERRAADAKLILASP
jgi:hypothetical protein